MKTYLRIMSLSVFLILVACSANNAYLHAQTAGKIQGTIVDDDGNPIMGVTVRIPEKGIGAFTDKKGMFKTPALEPGTYTVSLTAIGYSKKLRVVTISQGELATVDETLRNEPMNMNEVVVYGASRREQKITDAPAAVSIVLPEDIKRGTSHGQIGKMLESMPGVDVAQSGMNDFSINTRGFNNSINRRMLVLIDGRDPSTPLLNLVEWNSFQTNLADIQTIEVVRGPGSALYGSNAYNGVINIITTSPRDVLGTRVSVTGGEFNTFRVDARHAMQLSNNIFIKANVGYSRQDQAWVVSRQTSTEYPGLQFDRPGNRAGIGVISNIDSLINQHRVANNLFGTLRADYYLDENQTSKILAEIGYSRYGNEYFVNQTGRILIPDVEKPYMRIAYNSPRWNVQAHWYNRNTPIPQIVMNAAATSAERSNVVVVDAQWNDSFMDNTVKIVAGASHEYQHVNTSVIGATPLLLPDNLYHNFSGIYAQAEFRILPNLQFIGAARFDRSTFFANQFSPKAAIVWEPMQGHTLRFTANRSFLRPSYPDLYRRSPAGLPQNLRDIDTAIARQFGVTPLGLSSVPQWNLGNPNITVESALSYEVGYKGIITEKFYVTVDGYINRRTNFISNPLGGLAPDVYNRVNYGNSQADAALRDSLSKRNLASDRLAKDPNANGSIAFIIAPNNIGLVEERGVEIGLNYYVNNHLKVWGNASYLDFKVIENTVGTNKIFPNTSPRRYNIGVDITGTIPSLRMPFDVSTSLRYNDGFTWVAGLFEGYVPAFAVLNLNAGVQITNDLRFGLNVFNLLDRRHYQIFGGTILQRYSTATLSYQF